VAALRGLDCVEGMDCLSLEFAGGARKLVPVDELDRIWRYGAAAEAVSLDRLGGGRGRSAAPRRRRRWWTRRPGSSSWRGHGTRGPRRPEGAARGLRALLRRLPAHADAGPGGGGGGGAARPRAGRPMDRLVCGDVGFGKTEVALRAAAAVALAGAQVAVLAPTTVLARQHLDSFRRRFAPLGIAVGGLSRLTPPAEARQLRADLADGTLKVVVGTQAILSRATRFAWLGLVVVDEEQRFGARQKQALREVAQGEQAGVHVLAMTATPIPRSLQAALVGLQELSVIATAPARRQPIRTALAALEDGLLAEALRRERRRGGQSFVVVPRIEDMKEMRARIRAAAPRLSLVEAHGGMATAAADDAMIRFSEGRADVLLCTAIIETGPRRAARQHHAGLPGRALRAEPAAPAARPRRARRRARGGVAADRPRSPPPATTMKRLRALEALDRVGAGFASPRATSTCAARATCWARSRPGMCGCWACH
jgi:transcription-repair coupling factor (superfamily II helicase)